MRRFRDLLSLRLFFLIPLIGVIIFLPLTVLMIHLTGKRLMDETTAEAKRTNELIERSIHYGMLKNSKDDVARTIDALGYSAGVDGIRIYKKKGTIILSTDEREIGLTVDPMAEQCAVCHSSQRPLESVPEGARPRVLQSSRGYRILSVINPIRNEAECARPQCHPPPAQQKILGMLESETSLANVDKNIEESRSQMYLYSFGGIFLIVLLSGVFTYRMVHKPVHALAEGTRKVMDGDLDVMLDVPGGGEIGSLAQSINSILTDLKRTRAENEQWACAFEGRIEEKANELKLAQHQVLQLSKLATMGKLAATTAHEINNPLGGILTYVKLLQRQLSSGELSPDVCKTSVDQLQIIVSELKRCGGIVKCLLNFSKSPDSLFQKVDLHELIKKSLFIVNHHLEINRITKVEKLKAADPLLDGMDNQLQQAMVALFVNAVEAMTNYEEIRYGDTLTVMTEDVPETDSIRLTIKDNGKGIPKENLPCIFEPFFTTKEDQSGLGIGLSVVYGIVQTHSGKIEVNSEPGAGTEFIITLPRSREATKQL
jgi:two-component system NtrC family sensor kinase